MAAESANETGDAPKALGYLEQVRARARAGNNAVLPQITTTDQGLLRTAIKKERRAEFWHGMGTVLRSSSLGASNRWY
jgi:hypothetical protein